LGHGRSLLLRRSALQAYGCGPDNIAGVHLYGYLGPDGPYAPAVTVQEVPTMTMTTPTADEFAERLFQASLGFVEVLATYLGDRLGWYKALAAGGPANTDELVARAGGSARYAREWLEQQAVTGVLAVESDGRFRLPEGAAGVLAGPGR